MNVPEDNIDCESKSCTVISIGSLLVYQNKYYLQVYLDNRAEDKRMADDLDDNLFETDED